MKFTILLLAFLITPIGAHADQLSGISIENEREASSYERSLYNHWIDADDDDEDSRVEVLVEESQISPQLSENSSGKRFVSSGLWVGRYTGFVTTNPKQLDIDHLVPLKEVHRSGGHAWNSERKKAYANDLTDSRTLIAVYASANRSKSDKDPASWMPPNRSYWCEYLNGWIAVKKKWELSMDADEKAAIETGLQVCSRYRISDKIGGHE